MAGEPMIEPDPAEPRSAGALTREMPKPPRHQIVYEGASFFPPRKPKSDERDG